MTVIQNLVKASAAFAALAPIVPPAAPSAELIAAFRRFRYWSLRQYGLTAGPSAYHADADTALLRSGTLSRQGWDAYRANGLHWSERPQRLAAAILAASPLTPAEATAAAHALDGVTR